MGNPLIYLLMFLSGLQSQNSIQETTLFDQLSAPSTARQTQELDIWLHHLLESRLLLVRVLPKPVIFPSLPCRRLHPLLGPVNSLPSSDRELNLLLGPHVCNVGPSGLSYTSYVYQLVTLNSDCPADGDQTQSLLPKPDLLNFPLL